MNNQGSDGNTFKSSGHSESRKDPSSKSFGDTTSETSSSFNTQSGFTGKNADSTSSSENQDLKSEPLKERIDGHDSQNSDAIHPSSNLPSSSQEETGSKTQAPPLKEKRKKGSNPLTALSDDVSNFGMNNQGSDGNTFESSGHSESKKDVPRTGSTTKSPESNFTISSITREGCSVRVDLQQLRAYEQERLILRQGTEETVGPCKDSSTTYTIHREDNHPYFIDRLNNKAIAQYSYYYIDGSGYKKNVSVDGVDILQDPKTYFVLKDEPCPVKEIYGRDTVEIVKCKRKYFMKSSGDKEYATECEETDQRVAVSKDFKNCPLSHDFTQNQSFIQARKVYQFPGEAVVEYEACSPDNRRPLPHIVVACEPEIIDGVRFDRDRIEVEVDNERVVIRPCQKKSHDGIPLDKEYSNTVYVHLDKVSHPYARKYYTFNGKKHYVTPLEVDPSVQFEHQTRLISYDYRDDLKKAIPIEQHYFIDTNGNEVDAGVHPGSAIDYQDMNKTVLRDKSASTIEGCMKTTQQATYHQWQRPDQTLYFEKIRDENPLQEYVCHVEYVTERNVLRTYGSLYLHPKEPIRQKKKLSFQYEGERNTEEILKEFKSKHTYFIHPYMYCTETWEETRYDRLPVDKITINQKFYEIEEIIYSVKKRGDTIIGEKQILSKKTYTEIASQQYKNYDKIYD